MGVFKAEKKPIPVSVIRYDGENYDEVKKFCSYVTYIPRDKNLYVETLEGKMKCNPGDFIIKGPEGEFYPIKKEIFEKTYDVVGYWK